MEASSKFGIALPPLEASRFPYKRESKLRPQHSIILTNPKAEEAESMPATLVLSQQHLGDCQNCGPFLGPYYNTRPNTGPNLGDPRGDHDVDNHPYPS